MNLRDCLLCWYYGVNRKFRSYYGCYTNIYDFINLVSIRTQEIQCERTSVFLQFIIVREQKLYCSFSILIYCLNPFRAYVY